MIKALKKVQEWSLFGKKPIEETQTTIGMETEEALLLKLSSGEVEFTIFDFAGQLEYSTVHQVKITSKMLNLFVFFYIQFFLSNSNAIYLLVVDVSQSLEKQRESIEYWLNFLRCHLQFEKHISKAFDIILVGTKIDLPKAIEQKEKTNKMFEEYILANQATKLHLSLLRLTKRAKNCSK